MIWHSGCVKPERYRQISSNVKVAQFIEVLREKR